MSNTKAAGTATTLGNKRPNVLFIMTDNQRADTIAALGNSHIYTPNFDRLVRRGVAFDNAYTPCPICVPARYVIRTGCEPPTTRSFSNTPPAPLASQPQAMEERCGPYLARRMCQLGYRTFGIGKFHPVPEHEDLGFEVYNQVKDLYTDAAAREHDSYAAWIAKHHPEYDFLEHLTGEKADMFYMPQMRAMPAEVCMEHWTATRAVEEIQREDGRPYFGFVSFIDPHPPFAPPIPFNRMYDPDRMPAPIGGDVETDHMDAHIPEMVHALWAEDMSPLRARVLKARYYGEVSWVDHCLGRILDAVEAGPDPDNTLIAFFTDHGDLLGDHHAWHLGGCFDATSRIPFLVSWPKRLPAGVRRSELVSLVDLFGIATHAAGAPETREGIDVIDLVQGQGEARGFVFGWLGLPGKRGFRMMARSPRYKYIYIARGGREQLFDLQEDPHETRNLIAVRPTAADEIRQAAIAACRQPGAADALDGDRFLAFPYAPPVPRRIRQFDRARGVTDFPKHPADVLKK